MANVSVATVSRVLKQDPPRFGRNWKSGAWEAARELGYTPNLLGKNLRQKRTGIIFGDDVRLQIPFCSKVTGIANEAEKHNYHGMICATNELAREGKNLFGALKNRMADGMIVLSSTLSADEMSLISNHAAIVSAVNTQPAKTRRSFQLTTALLPRTLVSTWFLNGRKRIFVYRRGQPWFPRILGWRDTAPGTELPRPALRSGAGTLQQLWLPQHHARGRQIFGGGHTFDAVFAFQTAWRPARCQLRKHGLTVPEDEVIGWQYGHYLHGRGRRWQPFPDHGQKWEAAFSILYEKLNGGVSNG